MSRILPLPADAIAQIHSSKHITSLQNVVLALLENSLDADATKVEIVCDFRRGGCTIEDNGSGILPTEFEENSGLGKLYHTSKRSLESSANELHGSTGTYLASLAAVSLVSIVSQHVEHAIVGQLTAHLGKTIERHISNDTQESACFLNNHGTQVTVRDLFGNMPVRVKQRALTEDPNSVADEKTFHELKRGIVALLLAWSRPCSVRLRDANVPARTVSLAAAHPAVSGVLTEKHLNQLAGRAVQRDMQDNLAVMFQAGLAPSDSRYSWVPIKASAGGVSVKGLICLDPAPTKLCQFVSIGVHACSAVSGHNDLYDVINKTFAQSSFGVSDDHNDALDEGQKDRRHLERRYKSDGYTRSQLQGRKGVDRWPMFVLQLRLHSPVKSYSGPDDISDTSLKSAVDLLGATTLQWLSANHFRPRKRNARKNDQQQAPLSASSTPSRPTSGVQSVSGMPRTPDRLSAKRATTANSAARSKRHKPGHSANLGPLQPDGRRAQTSYFDGLSRIKSSRGVLNERSYKERKSTTAPAGQIGTINSPQPSIPNTVFRLPDLRAGELDSRPQTTSSAFAAADPAATEFDTTLEALQIAREASDDFGSIDEDDMLRIVQGNETPGIPCNDVEDTNALNENDEVVDWVDPVSKEAYKVNSRTGIVLPVRISRSCDPRDPQELPSGSRRSAAIDMRLTSVGNARRLSRRAHAPTGELQSRSLPGFLTDWKNPVFQNQSEAKIPVASFDGPGIDVAQAGNRRCTDQVLQQHFAQAGKKGSSKLSKQQLEQAKVIKQVDGKFILCLVSSSADGDNANTLILIDQHAASERVILEKLLHDLCTPVQTAPSEHTLVSNLGHRADVRTTMLEPSQRFQVSAAESNLFRTQAPDFAQWGVLYDLTLRSTVSAPSRVRQPEAEHILTVRALPSGIAERCALFPNILVELLRSEAWAADTRSSTKTEGHGATEDDGGHAWLRQLGGCPKGILDMLNSRACRSAIMFNDMLSADQCADLVRALAKCAFPFMCAHGRVSMVPIMHLGPGEGEPGLVGFGASLSACHGENKSSYATAFRRWKGAENLDTDIVL